MNKETSKIDNPEITMTAILELRGKNATGFVIPESQVLKLGTSRKPQVNVTFKNFTYRTSIASMKGEFLLPVSADIRNQTKVKAGDKLESKISLDTEVREIILPDYFKNALSKIPTAEKFYKGLSYSNQRRLVQPLLDAKTDETRQKRVEKTLDNLKKGII